MSIITMLNPRRRRLTVLVLMLVALVVLVLQWSGQQEGGVVQRQVGEEGVLGVCPHVQRPMDLSRWESPWQLLEETAPGGLKVYLYSATFFMRHRGGGRTVQQVKVLAVGTDPRLYTPHCLLWYPGEDVPHTTPASVATQGVPATDGNMSREVHQYVLTCSLPSTNPLPTHVSMVSNVPCITPHNMVEIHKPTTDRLLHQFGVCVPAASGDWSDVHVVEWLEVQRVLGVSEFTIYHRGGFSSRLQHTLQHYVHAGIVQLRPIPTPPGLAGALLDTVSLTDCLLRNMARYHRLLVVDFNDLLVPRRARSYSTMMTSLKWELKENRPDAFSFQVATFSTDCRNHTRGQSILFRYLRRTEPAATTRGGSFPLMLDPKQCVALVRGGCVKQSSTSLSLVWAVTGDVAISHHYQPLQEGTCDFDALHDRTGVYDDVLMKFKLRVMAASPITLDPWKDL